MQCLIIFSLFSIFYSTEIVIPLFSELYDDLRVSLIFHSLSSTARTPSLQLPLSLGSFVTWIKEDLVEDPLSFIKKEKNTKGKVKDALLSGYIGHLTAEFEKTNVIFENFPFVFITEIDGKTTKEKTFGLSVGSLVLLYLENKYSIHQFLIDHEKKQLLFSNEFYKNQYSSFFAKSCLVQAFSEDKPLINWRCKLNSVVINKKEVYKTNSKGETEKLVYQEENIVFNTTQDSIFSSTEYFIMVPRGFFTLLKDEVFANQEDCFVDSFNESKAFFCRGKIFHSLPESISFIIEDFEIKIPFQNLFTKFDSFYVFMVVESSSMWVLGLPFLRNQPMMFDDKEKRVTFFSQVAKFYEVKFAPGKAPEVIKAQGYLIFFNILILGAFTVVLMIKKKRLHS